MTDDAADLWRSYEHLQAELAASNNLGDGNWGLEAALNAILDRLAELPHRPTSPETMAASAARRERNRARLRRENASRFVYGVADGPARFNARVELAEIRRQLPARDWQLISWVALGMEYMVVAKRLGGTVGGLRIRVARIRRTLQAAA